MNAFPHQLLHDLTGASARLSAIVSLLRDPETRASLDMALVDRDVKDALKKFEEHWKQACIKQADQE